MFGTNPIAKREIDTKDGTVLRVVSGSPWYTIQGEGPFAGRTAVFLRLHGCPLRCHFCDTEFSRPDDPEVFVTELVSQIQAVAPEHCRLLVVTGGEPTRQNLKPLIEAMSERCWTVQIETAGVFWQECLLHTVIVVSPKLNAVHPMIHAHAHAFKYVVSAKEGVDQADGLPVANTQVTPTDPSVRRLVALAKPRQYADVFLSPMDEGNEADNAANRALVAKLAMQYGYRAQLQMHKFLGVD